MNLEVALSITLVAVGLLLSIRHFRLTRTVSYIERFNSVDMIETRAKVDEWTASSTDDEERLRKLEENHLLNAHVKAFLNLLTELAIAHRYGLLIPEVTFQLWYPAVPEQWERLRFYIVSNRNRGIEIGVNFEIFYRDMVRYRSDWKRRFPILGHLFRVRRLPRRSPE